MKRFIGLFIALVALVVTSTSALAEQAVPVLTTRVLPAKKTNINVAGAYVDSARFMRAAATTSTPPETLLIDTSDWDWLYPAGNASATTNYSVAFLNFSIPAGSLGMVASGVDSIYCLYQTSADGSGWHVTQTATNLPTWTGAGNYARIPIFADQDATGASAIFGQRYIRIIVQGDTGGKLGDLQASITYWRRPDADPVQNGPASFR